jgi:predicted nuclease of predicted toxin-antitoxin system
MKFIIDQQLPPALCAWLQERGHEAEHVRDVGLREASDSDIWLRALSTGAIIVTKDEDFASRRKVVVSGPAIVWLRCGNVSTSALLDLLTGEWSAIASELEQATSVIEVR